MTGRGAVDTYIRSHPRETLQVTFILVCAFWQSSMVLVGLLLYGIARLLKVKKWVICIVGIVLSLDMAWYIGIDTAAFGREGFALNGVIWKGIFTDHLWLAVCYFYYHGLTFTFVPAPLFVSILFAIDGMYSLPHAAALKQLASGKLPGAPKEISDKAVNSRLRQLKEEAVNGTLLGISKRTQKPVVISDKAINQVLLVLGTTGGGKTMTLRRFYQRAVSKCYPLIILDGKPDPASIAWLQALSEKTGRPFFGFNGGNFYHYDCLSHGGFTELKDKIISLKDQWESDYYRTIAEDYLQTVFEVLLQSSETMDLKRVAECLDYDELAIAARKTKDKKLLQRVASLEHYERKDITGLQAHLNLLIHSELGSFFEKEHPVFNLVDAIQQGGVVYFALPALRFPHFAKVVGKLVINDLKAVIDRLHASTPIFTVFDEFSVFAGEQVLNLVNMGRGKGVHAIFGTQGLADLTKVEPAFLNQLLNCVNTLICHRLNDHESAEGIANWIGTKDAFTVTAQIGQGQGATGLGTVRSNKEFIIHPDWIKQSLQTGEAFYVTKVAGFKWDKVKVKLTV